MECISEREKNLTHWYVNGCTKLTKTPIGCNQPKINGNRMRSSRFENAKRRKYCWNHKQLHHPIAATQLDGKSFDGMAYFFWMWRMQIISTLSYCREITRTTIPSAGNQSKSHCLNNCYTNRHTLQLGYK